VPTRRPNRNAAEWQSLIRRQAKSELNAREFCDAQDLSYASFVQWRSKLRKEAVVDDTGAADFIELTGAGMSAPPSVITAPIADNDTPVMIELSLGTDMTLRISRSR